MGIGDPYGLLVGMERVMEEKTAQRCFCGQAEGRRWSMASNCYITLVGGTKMVY